MNLSYSECVCIKEEQRGGGTAVLLYSPVRPFDLIIADRTFTHTHTPPLVQ